MQAITAVVQTSLQRYLAALQHRDYRTLWFATLWAGAAAWALIVLRGWVTYEMTHSSLWVGLATFAAMAPRVVITPIAGYFADRVDRRTLLAWTYGINLVHNLVLGILVVTGRVELWHLIALAFVNGTARAAQMVTSSALLPNLVPQKDLLNAIALNSATQQGDKLVGPALIAPLLATVGAGPAFFLCTVLYGLGIVQILRIRTVSRGGVQNEQGVLESLTKGMVHVYQTPLLRSVIILVAAHCGLTMAYESMLPSLSTTKLGAEKGLAFSLLLMLVGAGAMVSNLWLAGVRAEKTRGRLYFAMGVGSALSYLFLGLSPNIPVALIAAFTVGFTQSGYMSINQTIVQTVAPDSLRGRISGVQQWHTGGMMAVINLLNGSLVDSVGAPLLIGISGFMMLGVMALSLASRPLLTLYTRGTPAVAPAAAT